MKTNASNQNKEAEFPNKELKVLSTEMGSFQEKEWETVIKSKKKLSQIDRNCAEK